MGYSYVQAYIPGPLSIVSPEPRVILRESDGAANEKLWDIDVSSKVFAIRTRTDADGAGLTALAITRGVGTLISAAEFAFGANASFVIRGDANTRNLSWSTNGGNGGVFAFSGALSGAGMFFEAAGFTFNDSGVDADFRIESDANPNQFVSDAGINSGVGALGFGGPVVAYAAAAFNLPAISAPGNSGFYRVLVETVNAALTIPAGTAASVASLFVREPNLTATGTVPDAYTVIIPDAPTEGTRNGALWVGAGQVRFSGLPTSAAGLPAGTLWNNAGVVNVA